MKLSDLLEEETGVERKNLVFLRHSTERTNKLLGVGGTIGEYTSVQDIGGDYDFLHASKPPAHIVAVIVDARVQGVYRVRGVLREGLIDVIATPAYWHFVQLVGKKNVPSRLFDLEEFRSGAIGAHVTGWTAPVLSVLRGSIRGMFTKIEVDAVPIARAAGRTSVGRTGSALTKVATQKVQVTAEGMEALRKLIPRGRYGIDFRSSAENGGKIYVERHREWLLTIYAGNVAAGHSEIEMAMALPRLAGFPEKRSATLDWLGAEKLALGAAGGRSRSEPKVETFRIGLFLKQAQEDFLPGLRENLNPLTATWAQRLIGPGTTESPSPSAASDVAQPAATPQPQPFALSVDQMLRNAKKACAESGREVVEVLKEKQFKFPDDESFRSYVVGLLEGQSGRCKLSGLPLQDPGQGGDPQLYPSLDRINSGGHYEPGNLQIVCRFINRWKSDELDDEFRRLLAALRTESGH
ncbi:MAG TPA: hypothetical protein VLJ58_20015 [Ramlibacter sp.]|nr:hypothetical protein [Ramlibacter sp.]